MKIRNCLNNIYFKEKSRLVPTLIWSVPILHAWTYLKQHRYDLIRESERLKFRFNGCNIDLLPFMRWQCRREYEFTDKLHDFEISVCLLSNKEVKRVVYDEVPF